MLSCNRKTVLRW